MVNKSTFHKRLLSFAIVCVAACGGCGNDFEAPRVSSFDIVLAEDSSTSAALSANFESQHKITYHIVTNPLNGTITLNDSHFVYRPRPDFYGDDSFTYRATQDGRDSNIATVGIHVTPVNDPPRATSQVINLDEASPIQFNLAIADIDSNSLTIEILKETDHGEIIIENGNVVQYTPEDNFYGEDSFVYRVNDGKLNSASATLTLRVNPIRNKLSGMFQQLEIGGISDEPDSLNLRALDPSALNPSKFDITTSNTASLNLTIVTPKIDTKPDLLTLTVSGNVANLDMKKKDNQKNFLVGQVHSQKSPIKPITYSKSINFKNLRAKTIFEKEMIFTLKSQYHTTHRKQ